MAVGLGRRVRGDLSGLGLPELIAAVLDPRAPEAQLATARQAVGVGLRPWAVADSSPPLSPHQGLRLRLLLALVQLVEAEGATLPTPIQGPRDVLPHVLDIRAGNQERVVALYLDARNRPVHRELVALGGLRASVLQPRDVLAPALRFPVLSLVLVHNHPSGDTRPSPEDIEVTRQLAAAAELLGLSLADHLVVSRTGYTSLRELGML